MTYLLDTHVLIWASEKPGELGNKSRDILLDSENVLKVSPVSTLEIARLAALKHITLRGPLSAWIRKSKENLCAETTLFDDAVAIKTYDLPGEFHKDPADRMLVATALLEKAILLTADERILAYPHVRTFNARF